jgi:hypothetical protein
VKTFLLFIWIVGQYHEPIFVDTYVSAAECQSTADVWRATGRPGLHEAVCLPTRGSR